MRNLNGGGKCWLVLVALLACGCFGSAPAKSTQSPPAETQSGASPSVTGAPEATAQAVSNKDVDSNAAPSATEARLPVISTAVPVSSASSSLPAQSKLDLNLQKRIRSIADKWNATDTAIKKHDLAEILRAFNDFHDVFGQLPALNKRGDKPAPQAGLNWRVSILPYIGHTALYVQFNPNEPWDSDSNRMLIPKMPRAFGANTEGKTRLHAFAGNDTPLRNDLGVTLSDVKDGLSNTILLVEGGVDSAEIWTKPGGLKFDPQDPFKCLGQIGDEVLVGMLDGSVRTMPKSIEPQQFTSLVQISDGQKIKNGILKAVNPSELVVPNRQPQILDPATPLAPASQRLETAYIPDDAFAALIAHPRRAYRHPVVKSIFDQLSSMPNPRRNSTVVLDVIFTWRRNYQKNSDIGFAWQDIDEVIMLFDKSFPKAVQNNNPAQYGLIVRRGAPIDIERSVEALLSPDLSRISLDLNRVRIEEFGGVTLIVSDSASQEEVAYTYITESLSLIGEVNFVKKMISAGEQHGQRTTLTKRLSSIDYSLAALVVDETTGVLQQAAKQMPEPFSQLATEIVGAREFTVSIDLEGSQLIKSTLQYENASRASEQFARLDDQIKQVKSQFELLKSLVTNDPGWGPLLNYADQIVGGLKFENSGETLLVKVPNLQQLDKLPERVKPLLEQNRDIVEREMRMSNLMRLGRAVADYREQFGRFPALNGSGSKDEPHTGLSWRVSILPFIGKSGLYTQFRHDEPWDSVHNRALIAKMPVQFGTDPEFKTSIHVFTGPGAPFQNDQGLSLEEITDGPNNTFMVVETGADTAGIWTKPGGLEFDPQDPLKCLGKTHQFTAVMMNGMGRHFQNKLDPDLFRKLVQYADGQAVGKF